MVTSLYQKIVFSFNSILMQLYPVHIPNLLSYAFLWFQFHIGAIISSRKSVTTYKNRLSFNSILVKLYRGAKTDAAHYFCISIPYWCNYIKKDTFFPSRRMPVSIPYWCNYIIYEGGLKSQTDHWFQFHIGAIISRVRFRVPYEFLYVFNSILVQLYPVRWAAEKGWFYWFVAHNFW